MDEIYSFIIANNDTFPFDTIIEELKSQRSLRHIQEILYDYWLKSFSYDDFQDICYISSNNNSSLLTTYLNKSICDEHPPLYYLVLHLVCSLTHSSDLILIGYTINILSMLFVCVFVFKIVKILQGESAIAILAVAYFGLSYGFLCFITLCRMYALNAMLLTYIAFLYLKLNKESPRSGSFLIVICCVEVLAMLTSYFSFLFILPFFLYELYNLRDDKRQRCKYIYYHILACGIYLLVWPQVILYFLNGISVRSQLDFNMIERVCYYFKFALLALFSNKYIAFFVSVILFASVLYRFLLKESADGLTKSQRTIGIILIPSLSYFLIVMIISPWMHHRYMYPVYPIFSIIFILSIYDSLKIIFESYIHRILVLSIFVSLLSVIFVPEVPIEYLYPKTEKKDNFCLQYGQCHAIILTNSFNLKPLQAMANYQHKSYRIINTSVSGEDIINQFDQLIVYVDRSDSIILQDYVRSNIFEISPLNVVDELFDIYFIKKIL